MDFNPDGVYASSEGHNRVPLSLDDVREMDMVDDDGQEIQVYCEKGFVIPRRVPRYSKNTPAHGLLLNLTTVKELFEPNDYDNEGLDWDEEDDSITTYVYPQAGLKTAGHFQANGIMRSFKRFVTEVNESLKDVEHDEDVTLVAGGSPPIVRGIASQGYNGVMHSTRGHSAQHHNAQLGIITAALAGRWATGNMNTRVATEFQEKCSHQLPHKAFEEKIKNKNIIRDLRLENVYYVDVKAMCENDRNGRYLFQKTLSPMPVLCLCLKHTVLFLKRLYILSPMLGTIPL
jgi:hypothetical protein